ncbi:MAG TPA: DUF427 domain-containing protein [Acidimicrobiia bacterium]|jgi:uncharacterized protein (DUF427 family)
MARAYLGDVLIAESDNTVIVEGNHYFPPSSVKLDLFTENTRQTTCPWKGVASYYDLEVDGKVLPAAAWYYPEPKDKASHIKDHIAFYPVVTVEP